MLTNLELYSYKQSPNPTLNRMASRSVVGSLATLTTSVANLTVLMVLRGEPGWICLMCCNVDILFCVLVLHWMTSKDKPASYASTHASLHNGPDSSKRAHAPSQARHSGVPEKPDSCPSNNSIVELGLYRQQTALSTWQYEHSPTPPTAFTLPGSA